MKARQFIKLQGNNTESRQQVQFQADINYTPIPQFCVFCLVWFQFSAVVLPYLNVDPVLI